MEFGDSGFWCLWEMTREKQAIRDTKEKKQKPKKKNEKQKKKTKNGEKSSLPQRMNSYQKTSKYTFFLVFKIKN